MIGELWGNKNELPSDEYEHLYRSLFDGYRVAQKTFGFSKLPAADRLIIGPAVKQRTVKEKRIEIIAEEARIIEPQFRHMNTSNDQEVSRRNALDAAIKRLKRRLRIKPGQSPELIQEAARVLGWHSKTASIPDDYDKTPHY